MAKHGTLGVDLSKGGWKSYVERAKLYFAANDVTDNDKQREIFLSACGDATYRRIKDVLTWEAPGETSFKTIIEKMTQHLQPRVSLSSNHWMLLIMWIPHDMIVSDMKSKRARKLMNIHRLIINFVYMYYVYYTHVYNLC